MIASEIASGKPRGQTYADNRISLLVESDQATEVVGSIVENIIALSAPTLSDLTAIVDKYFVRNTTILLVFQADNTLHLLARGNGTIYLKRNDNTVPLLSNNSSASGPIEENDIFILAGQSFLSSVTPSVFTILLEKTNNTEVEEKLIAYLEQNAKTDILCLLLFNIPSSHDDLVINELPEKPKRKFTVPTFPIGAIFSSFTPRSKQQRLTIVIGGILLLLLVASLVFGSRERKRIGDSREFEELKTEISQKLSEAEQMVDIAPEQAEPILANSLNFLQSKKEQFPETSPHHAEYNQLIAKANELSNRAKRKYTVEPVVFFDISWIKDTAMANNLTITENTLFLTDTDNGAIYEVGLEQKKSSIIGTNDIFKQAVSLNLFQGNPFTFVEGSTARVVNKKGEEAIGHNSSWGQIIDSKSFGGNIYLLDRNNQIWKHPGSESGFGSGSEWLTDDASVDFSNAQSFSIDGNIWVLTGNEILKLAMGGQDQFFLKDESVTQGKKIWTSENSDYLYILEDKRVVVFDKNGNYYQQYLWEGFEKVTDFAVSETLEKMLILQHDKIYSIDLKQ